jgi:hypothetical protein
MASAWSEVTIKKGKREIVRQTRKEHDVDHLEELAGDGKASIEKDVLLGLSEEVRNGLWMKAEVRTAVRLSCDQSKEGLMAGNDAAYEAALELARTNLVEAHEFIQDFVKGD